MKFKFFLILILLIFMSSCKAKEKVLVFTKTEGYRHESIETGVETIKKLGEYNNFEVIHTEDSNTFSIENLKAYQLVLFLSTTGDVLNDEQEKAFKSYINSGGSYMGIHAASDTEYDWGWYGELVGAYFLSHPKQCNAIINVVDNTHLSTKHLEKQWIRWDEWYNFKNINNNTHVLLTLDESSYEGGKNGAYHPIAWFHEFDGGRSFYTGLGHTKESYSESDFKQHLLGGILYCLKR